MQQIEQEYPEATVEVWGMDEHRLGLKPVIRRVWIARGEQPIANVHWRYQWLWLYGFVHPVTGETYFWILPKVTHLAKRKMGRLQQIVLLSQRLITGLLSLPIFLSRNLVNIDLFNQVLADFAREFDVSQDKQIILTLDQAGWHTSEQVKIPQGLHLEFIPSHSPELQPAERLWPLVNEPIANRSFKDLDELEEILFQRCQVLLKQPSLIKEITQFYWWPKTRNISFRCNRN